MNEIAARRYAGVLTDRWNALSGTSNGGYSLAVCLQALKREMVKLDFPDPLAVSAFFLKPATPGPVQIHTEVARVGKRVATGEARLLRDDQEIVRVVASFTDLPQASGPTLLLNRMPELPPVQQCVDLLGGKGMPGVSITEQVHYRVARLPGWVQGKPSGEGTMEFWMRYADGSDADTVSLAALVDAAAPAVLELGQRGSSTVELTVHIRARPAPGWLACRVSTRHVIEGYHEEDFEIWDSRGQLVAQSRQLAVLHRATS
ncbi:thioesterase family protein [Undibacterium sp.]|uniref:thioesterase family protein n=1 Tax=Undibacterium sp. TaxID=1914977 RepID=UPI002C98543E|nr:thioesterase family protein [Undibacterium sp.]HTD03079.1 thioesterase family protein [Undibacterium sp.]